MDQPLISIIMPAYNAEIYIEDSIKSVLNQTYKNWELLIINDGSTDATASIVDKYVSIDSRIKLINQANKRLGAARNTGIKNSIGEWIAFLDSDDLWDPAKLEKQISLSCDFSDVDVIFTDGWIFNNNNLNELLPYPTIWGKYLANEMYKLLYKGNIIPVLSVIVKADKINKVGLQEEDPFFHGCEDWDYWLRMTKENAVFYGIHEKLFYYRRHENNMSGNSITMRLAQASVFFKNFKFEIFDKTETQNIFKPLIIPLIIDLAKENKLKECYYVLDNIQKVSPAIKYTLIKLSIYMLGARSSHLLAFVKKCLTLSILKKKYNSFFYNKRKLFPKNATVTLGTSFLIGKHNNINVENKAILNIGDGVVIGEFCNIFVSKNANLIISDSVFMNNYCSLNCLGKIEIGKNTIFGEGVKLYDHNHKYEYDQQKILKVERNTFKINDIKIGSDCWIGSNVTILMGVEIGDNVIIGANNLIFKSIPANTIIKSKAEYIEINQ